MVMPILKMEQISKSFPGVKALEDVDLQLYQGRVHALLGENGAGKSTLMKILGGVYRKDSGSIYIRGQKVDIAGPRHSQNLGIAVIHQELNLIQHLSIAENIFLGREYRKKFSRRLDWEKLHGESRRYLRKLGIETDPKTLVKDLGVGEQQMVEIAKALSLDAEIIIMDEPTAALTNQEIDKLFAIIRNLKQSGKVIVYISHKLDEVFEICDQVTVLRDGKHIGSAEVKDLNQQQLIQMMVGRRLEEKFLREVVTPGREVLRVAKLSKKGLLQEIDFTVSAGEVLGIAGLMGAGRTELAKAIFGALKIDSGEIYLEGRKIKVRSPREAVRHGIAYLSEDRKMEGLFLELSIKHNISISSLDELARLGKINNRAETKRVEGYIQKLKIKTPAMKQTVKHLSGGNQQKVVLSKWMMTQPKVLILDEPTRGVDVGAKIEIYNLINRLKESGVAIILISSELPEVMGISDRIMVIHEGRVTGTYTHDEASQEKIMRSAFGMRQGE
ncbi:MAG: sugar ABC transporter ATP-binding protein [Bacillota bacterium]